MAEVDRKKMRSQWRAHKLMWNLSGGRLGRKVDGVPVLELVTTGHRSGRERQILIWHFDSPEGPAIIGTNGGRDVDPAWVKNLRANPVARARWNGTWHDVKAVELSGAAYEAAWNAGVAASAGYETYRKMLTRPIPIIRLEPR